MRELFNITAPKKPTNVSLNSDLLQKARTLKINLSAALEEALAQKVREKQKAQWLEENEKALQEYNDHAEKHGVFSKGLRSF